MSQIYLRESGRFIASSHAVLIAPVLELFSSEYHEKSLRLKEQNPPLIEELYDLWKSINRSNAREYLHDSLDHMESLLTPFLILGNILDLGRLGFQILGNSLRFKLNFLKKVLIIILFQQNWRVT